MRPKELDEAMDSMESGAKLDRREFLKRAAGIGTVAAVSAVGAAGCARLSSRIASPPPLVPWRDSLLLTNVIPVDVEKGELLAARSVLIRSGRIEALISQEGDRQSLKADREIDLGGRYLIPGLVNAHCHMMLPGGIGASLPFLLANARQRERNAEECIRHGVTTVRDMLGLTGWLDDLEGKIQNGEIIGPRILKSAAIQVPGGYVAYLRKLDGDRTIQLVESPDECRRAVWNAAESGADQIKIFMQYQDLVLPGEPMPVLTQEMVSAIEEEAEKCGAIVAAHSTFLDGHRRLAAGRVPSFEHIARDQPLTDDDVKVFVDAGASFVPTASVAWALAFERAGDPNWSDEKVQRLARDRESRLPGLMKEFLEEPVRAASLDFLARYSHPSYFEHWHLLPVPDPQFFTAAATVGYDNMMRLVDAGARMGCGNDGGVPFIFPGALYLEMAILEQAGIPAAQVLKAATATNAAILRKEKELGTIGEGKRADLVALDKNPLESMENVAAVSAVFRDGRLLYSKPGALEGTEKGDQRTAA